MPITGFLIRTEMGREEQLIKKFTAVSAGMDAETEGSLAIGATAEGRIGIATDTPSSKAEDDLVRRLEKIDGVTTVEAVYHNFEDLVEAEPAAEQGRDR